MVGGKAPARAVDLRCCQYCPDQSDSRCCNTIQTKTPGTPLLVGWKRIAIGTGLLRLTFRLSVLLVMSIKFKRKLRTSVRVCKRVGCGGGELKHSSDVLSKKMSG